MQINPQHDILKSQMNLKYKIRAFLTAELFIYVLAFLNM
jgi:hypothetical protein